MFFTSGINRARIAIRGRLHDCIFICYVSSFQIDPYILQSLPGMKALPLKGTVQQWPRREKIMRLFSFLRESFFSFFRVCDVQEFYYNVFQGWCINRIKFCKNTDNESPHKSYNTQQVAGKTFLINEASSWIHCTRRCRNFFFFNRAITAVWMAFNHHGTHSIK